jgi:hypothetical protein
MLRPSNPQPRTQGLSLMIWRTSGKLRISPQNDLFVAQFVTSTCALGIVERYRILSGHGPICDEHQAMPHLKLAVPNARRPESHDMLRMTVELKARYNPPTSDTISTNCEARSCQPHLLRQ